MALSQPQQAALDAECAVVGAMLIDESCVPLVLRSVRPEEFDFERNRQLFLGARMQYTAGKGVDAVTILGAIGKSEDKDYRQYCADLMAMTPTIANIAEHITLLHTQAQLRELKAAAAAITMASTLDACSGPLHRLTETYSTGQTIEAKTLAEMLAEFADRKETQAPKEYIGIGIDVIDRNTYLERGDVAVIGGAPSDGKTAFALIAAYHMARTLNVGFYSLETKYDKLEDRLVSSGFQIDFGAIKRSQMTDEDWARFADGFDDACKRRLTVLHASGLTAEQIVSSARARGFDAIFIDYVQLIKPAETRNVPRHEQVSAISQTLHTFAQQTGTLVVELAQLSRKERGTKREADMFDLGESSQLERDADLVLLLYRPPKGARYYEDDKDSEPLDPDKTRILRIAKQKEGQRVRLPLTFDGAHQSFYVMGQNPYAAIRRASKAAQRKSVVEGGVQQFIPLSGNAEEGMPF